MIQWGWYLGGEVGDIAQHPPVHAQTDSSIALLFSLPSPFLLVFIHTAPLINHPAPTPATSQGCSCMSTLRIEAGGTSVRSEGEGRRCFLHPHPACPPHPHPQHGQRARRQALTLGYSKRPSAQIVQGRVRSFLADVCSHDVFGKYFRSSYWVWGLGACRQRVVTSRLAPPYRSPQKRSVASCYHLKEISC